MVSFRNHSLRILRVEYCSICTCLLEDDNSHRIIQEIGTIYNSSSDTGIDALSDDVLESLPDHSFIAAPPKGKGGLEHFVQSYPHGGFLYLHTETAMRTDA